MFKRRPNPDPPVDPLDLPELADRRDQALLSDMETSGFWATARKLPRMIAGVMRWAWKADPRDTAAALALNIASGVATALVLGGVAGLLQELFAQGPTPERVTAAAPVLALVAAATMARGLLRNTAGWFQARLEPQVRALVEQQLFDLTSRVRLESYDDAAFCDALYRARDRGIYEISHLLRVSSDVITQLISLAAIASVLTVLHPLLLPLLILAVAPVGWAGATVAQMNYRRIRAFSTLNRRLYILSDYLANRPSAAELRAFTMRTGLLAQYTRLLHHVRTGMLEVIGRQTLVRTAGDSAAGIATALTLLALGALLFTGAMPLAIAGAAYIAQQQARSALSSLIYGITATYESGLYVADVHEVIAHARRRLPPRPTAPPPQPLDTLEVDGVVFAYPDEQRNALDDVSLTLDRGQIIALVGENGSGKSTLAKLIAGLYTPQSGEVRWNGTPVPDLDPDALRARIGLISQDYTQWPFSAERNITMAPEAPSDPHRLDRALRLSGADEVVDTLPRGLHTLLDKRFAGGADLSQGQRQRIAAARGLYRDADLLIADEPTAALDARAEARLFDTLRHAAHGRTVLLITHRLASVRMADHIVVLDHGHIAEQGSHEELIGQEGLYAELYGIQASAYTGQVSK